MAGFKETLKDALRQVSFRTSVDKLKKKGIQDVNVLGIDRLVGLVEAAVHRSLRSRLMGVDREAVAESTKAEFLRLLQSHEDLQREKTQIEQARERAEEEIDLMRRELARKQSALQVRLEADPVEQTNRYVGEDAAIATKVAEVLASIHESASTPTPDVLQDRLMALVMDVVHEERKTADSARKALQDREVDILQRRIKKLSATLTATEQQLARASVEQNVETGISSIYREVQGLDVSDQHAGKKRELMADIFRANLAMQKRSKGA